MSISIIVAVDENFGIGKDNKLLCYLPNDLKWFKKNTSDKKVVMGRNTFLSLPNGALPNRVNIVLTDKSSDSFENCSIYKSVDEVLKILEDNYENFVIGGASVYQQFLKYADKLYLTRIHNSFEADAFFPEIDFNEWKLVEKIENKADGKHAFDYDFEIYQKIKSI